MAPFESVVDSTGNLGVGSTRLHQTRRAPSSSQTPRLPAKRAAPRPPSPRSHQESHMAMDSTLKLDPSCVFFNDSVLSYTSMGPPTLSTDLGSPSHLFVERPSTAPAQISPGCGEVHEDPHKRRFPGPGYYELPSPDCVSQFPHRPASPHYSLASPRSRRAPPVGRRPKGRPLPPRRFPDSPGPASIPRSQLSSGRTSTDPGPRTFRSPRRARPDVFSADNPRWKLGKPHAYFGRDTLTAVWKSTCVSGAPDNSSLSHFSAMTRPTWLERRGTGIATPSSRRRVDGVEDDATIRHERAVKF
ncbi:unnamed protein product [Pelagomonas calceolata]|uniref:Uncharacterized protein n=1 Tax=Pelagomonas calceolata TaxID=35677 RepID=A0A8J2X155_9STRA|nr:unnamed protein product [Pelagomonas calceolata]